MVLWKYLHLSHDFIKTDNILALARVPVLLTCAVTSRDQMRPQMVTGEGRGAEIKFIMLRFCNSRDQNTLWRGHKNCFPQNLWVFWDHGRRARGRDDVPALVSCRAAISTLSTLRPLFLLVRWRSHKQMIFTILSCWAYLNSLYNFQVGWHSNFKT